ncbi:hypothetical protein [Halopseudomonas bauzanensis]|uniref:hypothetical protein n=1 Tax=Halopseudomonas bauzanensis TaxID=653930 RepID=UPI002554715D|nr:hypothetical protein [Halopseudomonas bauzanensis]
MSTRFGRAMERLHRVGQARLADSIGNYVDRNGAVLAQELELQVDRNVERFGEGHTVDRVATISALRSLIQPLDRKGAFVIGTETLHIDGIADDDGHLITFYVVP